MAVVAKFLIDSSALGRMRNSAVASVLEPLIDSGRVGTCAALDFEDLYSSRSPEHYRQTKWIRANRYEYLATEDGDWQRALDVQATLADAGRWREVGMPDLLIAAVCERNRMILLHYDADFDAVTGVTGQDTRWVVPRGSIA